MFQGPLFFVFFCSFVGSKSQSQSIRPPQVPGNLIWRKPVWPNPMPKQNAQSRSPGLKDTYLSQDQTKKSTPTPCGCGCNETKQSLETFATLSPGRGLAPASRVPVIGPRAPSAEARCGPADGLPHGPMFFRSWTWGGVKVGWGRFVFSFVWAGVQVGWGKGGPPDGPMGRWAARFIGVHGVRGHLFLFGVH